MSKSHTGVIAAGLALFSMFFGAGDLLWPLILGGESGDKNLYAMLGLLITGVTLPLIGLLSMMLFHGNYHEFFGRIGKTPSILLIFIVQAILGPLGSIPRAITLSYVSLKPYLPDELTLGLFSVVSCLLVFAFAFRPQRMISLLGLVLTPILLLTLGAILALGFWNPPSAQSVVLSPGEAFQNGLKVGYNTLDLIASFIFAPLVLTHFVMDEEEKNSVAGHKRIFKKMVQASLIAAGLLSIMYVGLTYVASFYVGSLEPNHLPEERLSAISSFLLGPQGGLLSSIAVAMACLTTAIPLVSICSNYIRDDLSAGRLASFWPLVITLGISGIIANMGFMGIAQMLSPVLQILCPGLI